MGRKIVSGLLIAFVIAAVVTLALRGRETPPTPTPAQPTATPTQPANAPAAQPVAARLVAFYFHGDKRCANCNTIERLTREALQAEVAANALEIRAVNVDTPANAHYVQDFELSMRTVVLAEEAGGKVVRYKRLDQVWERFNDPEDFAGYVRGSLREFRAAAQP